jgi:hypothetical protein
MGDVLTTSLDALDESGEIPNQVLNGIPLGAKLLKNVKKKKGGSVIRVPFEYGTNSTAKSFEHYDQLDMTPQTILTTGMYNWKAVAVTIMMSGMEMRANDGPEQIIDLWEARYKNALASMRNAIATMWWSDGSGNGYRDMLGLAAHVATTGTVAGVARATETWAAAKAVAGGSFASQGPADMRSLWVQVSNGLPETQPDLILMTTTIYNAYEKTLQGYEQFTRQPNTPKGGGLSPGDLGFGALTWKGAPIWWDDMCTAGVTYMLNTRYLYPYVHADAYFKPSPKKIMDDQDAWAQHLILQGELCCSAWRFQGKITGQSA